MLIYVCGSVELIKACCFAYRCFALQINLIDVFVCEWKWGKSAAVGMGTPTKSEPGAYILK